MNRKGQVGRVAIKSRRVRRYLLFIEHEAWAHLYWAPCRSCQTLLDAIGHVTREDEREVRIDEEKA